jgi:hypothetical protein
MPAEIRQEWEADLYMCMLAKQNFSKHADFIVGILNHAITEQEDRLRYERYPTPADRLAASQELLDMKSARNLLELRAVATQCVR